MTWRKGHWLWGHTHLVLISAQPLMSSAAPKNKDKAHEGLGPGAKLADGETVTCINVIDLNEGSSPRPVTQTFGLSV